MSKQDKWTEQAEELGNELIETFLAPDEPYMQSVHNFKQRLAAALRDAAKQERDACARLCDDWYPHRGETWEDADVHIAVAIRARGNGSHNAD